MKKKSALTGLLERGFDKSTHRPFATSTHVGCSQCEALVINGIACHEGGCPNSPSIRSRFGDPDEWEIDAAMAERGGRP